MDEVLAISSSPIANREELYDFVRTSVHWGSAFQPEEKFCVAPASVARDETYAAAVPGLRHAHFTALAVRDAVSDALREASCGTTRRRTDIERPDWVRLKSKRRFDYDHLEQALKGNR